jgi:thioredoxin reductase
MRTVDVAVVGAGPAGIAAALAAAESGAQTLLIDEHAAVGGHLRWRISQTLSSTAGLPVDPGPGPAVADQLAETLTNAGNLTVSLNTVAWGLFEDRVLMLASEDTAEEIQPGAIVLATGSSDIAAPFPGWTLPGVMTARAAQIFMHIHRVIPGRRWAILGEGDEARELVADLERCGLEVVIIHDSAENLRASGTNRLAHVEIDDDVFEVDGLAIALGRQPDAELAFQAQATGSFVRALGGYTPARSASGETSEPGVYVAGDAAGIASLDEIVAEGRLAGLAAAGAGDAIIQQAQAQLADVANHERRTAIEQIRLTVTTSGEGNS